jgi:hypothetical protein
MSLKARIDRLQRTAPCQACAGQTSRTVVHWLGDDEEPPTATEHAPAWCAMCERHVGQVQYLRWQRSDPPTLTAGGVREERLSARE